MPFTENDSADSRYKNIVYNSTIIAQGNVHIGDVYYNVTKDFHHAILFLKLEKTEEANTYLAQLSIKSKHHTIPQLLRQKVKVDISPALFKQVAGFQEVRRLDNLTFRGLGHITPENIRIEEEYLAEQIFNTFFQGDILTVCQDFIDLLEKRKISELMLAVSCEDNTVVNLPFEMVIPKFFPEKLGEKRQSLAVNHFGFVRTLETSLEGFEMQGKPIDAAPLKLLFVTALPENLSERSKMLEIEEEQKRLIDAIGSFEATGGEPKIVIEFLDTASLMEINDALQKHQHHVVHISGHGSYNAKTNQGVLHLEDDEGKHREVTGAELGETLRQHQCVKLLILSACETAVAGNGVVEQLATFGIPALVAMRFSVTDPAAILFTTELYTALVRGETLTLAIAQAREALWKRLEEQRRIHPDYVHLAEWFTPITYLNQYTEALVNLKGKYVLPEDFYPHSDFFKTKNTRLIGAGFVGRKRYLNQLRRHFTQGKHVCLHGLGGLGKTTLAEAFANNYDNHSHELLIFRNGHQLQEKFILDELLARLENDDKANKNIIRQPKNYLETDAKPIEKLQYLIANYLQNRKTILVFDNFEDVQRTEGGEQQCEIGNESLRDFYKHLCQNTPSNCHLLFTSRYTIADLSATVTHLSLDKMTYAEQYRLSNFSPTLRRIPMSDRQEVFKRLDGHPRAYEFLEALLKNEPDLGWENVAISIGKAESQVVENLLLAKIYDRLSPNQQELLGKASVFMTHSPIAALDHLYRKVNWKSPQVVEKLVYPYFSEMSWHDMTISIMDKNALKALSDWSLCYLDENNFFEIHRLTREWMNQYNPHQWFYNSLYGMSLGSYFKAESTKDDLELSIKYYELAEAWDFMAEVALNLEEYYRLTGHNSRAFELLQTILSKPINDEYKAITFNDLGLIYTLYGEYEKAITFLEQSLKLYQEIRNLNGIATALSNTSQIYHNRGDDDTALQYLMQSLQIFQNEENFSGEARVLNSIGNIYNTKGEHKKALLYVQQSLEISNKISDNQVKGSILNNLATIISFRDKNESALLYLQQSLNISQQIGDNEEQAATLHNLGIYYITNDDYKTGIEYLHKSLKILNESGDKGNNLATNLSSIGVAAFEKEDWEHAILFLFQAYKIFRKIGSPDEDTTAEFLNIIAQKIGENKIRKIVAKFKLSSF